MSRMNEENYEFITETVFPRFNIPQGLEPELRKQMQNGADTIVLEAAGNTGKDQKERAEVAYKFEYNDRDNRYYFNEIKASLTKEDGTAISTEQRIFNQRGYDTEQLLKILEGKFVYQAAQKEDKDYSHWAYISPVQKDENGNNILRRLYDNTTKFNLVLKVSELPLVNMSQQDKEKMLNDMRNGEPGLATIKKQDGSREKVELYPRPDIGRIDVFNKEGQRLKFGEEKLQAVGESKLQVKGQENSLKDISPAAQKLLGKAQEGATSEEKVPKKKIS